MTLTQVYLYRYAYKLYLKVIFWHLVRLHTGVLRFYNTTVNKVLPPPSCIYKRENATSQQSTINGVPLLVQRFYNLKWTSRPRKVEHRYRCVTTEMKHTQYNTVHGHRVKPGTFTEASYHRNTSPVAFRGTERSVETRRCRGASIQY